MRRYVFGIPVVLLTALALLVGDEGLSQPPGKKGPPDGGKGGKKGGKGFGGPGFIAPNDMVDRIMSFDKGGTGKIAKDDLPERMQYLLTMGDVNKDGFLDREEVRNMAGALEAVAALGQPGGGKGKGKGPGGPDGFGGPGGKGGFGGPGFKDGFGGPGFKDGFGAKGPKGIANLQRVIDELKLEEKTQKQATTLVKGAQDKLRIMNELARAELLVSMADVLSPADYKTFKAALENQPGPLGGNFAGPNDAAKRLDELQKELDDLRRRLKN